MGTTYLLLLDMKYTQRRRNYREAAAGMHVLNAVGTTDK